MVGAIMYFDESYGGEQVQRDYIQGRLSKKLTAGIAYCVSFWVNQTESSQYAVNNIGAYLDDGKIDTTHVCGLPQTQYTPQAFTSNVVYDSIGWTKIEGSFIANGTERFITIGNFFSKIATTAVYMPNPIIGINHFAYYLVDDVSVIELNLPADAGIDRHITKGDSTFIGRTPEVGLECKWYQNGSVIATGAGIWVRPQTTTSYVVEQTICGLVKKDTVNVYVWPAGVPSVAGAGMQQYDLYPNPNGGAFRLRQAVADERPVMAEVRNMVGSLVWQQELRFKGGQAALELEDLPAGMYLLQLKDSGGGSHVLRFAVE